MKRRTSVIGKRGTGSHQPEPTREVRPPGQIKKIISHQKHGKMLKHDEYHDPDPGYEMAAIKRGCIWFAIIAALISVAMCGATALHGQADFYSPFHFVVTTPQPGSKSITDIYHVSTHVVITETTVSIGVDSEGGQKFNYPIQGVEVDGGKVRYIIPEGIIIHAVTKEGESVTWINSKFQWRLYSFVPAFIEIEN